MIKIQIKTALLLILSILSAPLMADSARQEIRVAVRAHAGEQHAIEKWQATIAYLNQTLPDYRFVMRPYTSLKQQLSDAKHKKFEFLLTNPATYVELEVVNHARAMLTLINKRRDTAQTRFGSVIFTHVDNGDILRLHDLKGKHFMAVNRLGFGGWRIGLKILKDYDIDPDTDFASLQFAGKQPAVVQAVLDKKVHAGIVRTDMLERLADKGKVNLRSIRVLNQQHTKDFPFFHSSPLYPEWPFAHMPHVSTKLVEQVKQALLKIKPTDPAAISGKYIGWTAALDYQPVKDLLRDIGIAPFAKTNTHLRFLVGLFFILFVPLIVFLMIKRYSD